MREVRKWYIHSIVSSHIYSSDTCLSQWCIGGALCYMTGGIKLQKKCKKEKFRMHTSIICSAELRKNSCIPESRLSCVFFREKIYISKGWLLLMSLQNVASTLPVLRVAFGAWTRVSQALKNHCHHHPHHLALCLPTTIGEEAPIVSRGSRYQNPLLPLL